MRGEVYDGHGQEEAAMMSLQQLADRLFFRAKASEALSGVCPVSMSVWSAQSDEPAHFAAGGVGWGSSFRVLTIDLLSANLTGQRLPQANQNGKLHRPSTRQASGDRRNETSDSRATTFYNDQNPQQHKMIEIDKF